VSKLKYLERHCESRGWTDRSNSKSKGFPFATWTKRVNSRFKIPVNAAVLTIGFTTAMSLINIGSTTALNTMLSLSSVALTATYVLSIGCVLHRRLRKQPLPSARWSLGKHGLWVNCIGLVYASWSFFWCFWPSHYHVTAANFNWASVLFVAFVGVACLSYLIDGKRRYEEPGLRVQAWMNEW